MEDFVLSKEKHVQEIMDNFDFTKVERVMNHLNWTWFDSEKPPTISRLKSSAKKLLEDVYDTKTPDDQIYSISSGGFKAIKMNNFLDLEFVLSSFDSEHLNYGNEYEILKKNKERVNKINKIDKIKK